MKKEFKVISELIEKKSKALDVGCGDGDLMKYGHNTILLTDWFLGSMPLSYRHVF